MRPHEMKGVIFLAAAMMLVSPCTAAAQVTKADLNLALVQLERAVDGLGRARPQRLRDAVKWLQGRIGITDAAQVSPEYLRSLKSAAELLSVNPTSAIIDDVADELEAKVDHCRSLGIGMGGSVVLRVNTRRGTQTVNAWQVFYLLKIYERGSGASPAAFATLSAPAETRVEPGRYWIWARDPATGRMSDRTLLRVAGQKEFLADLPVP